MNFKKARFLQAEYIPGVLSGPEWANEKHKIFNNAVAQAGYTLTIKEVEKLSRLIDEYFKGKVESEKQLKGFEYLWELECYK